MTERPIIEIPEEVARKYKDATPEIVKEASREGASAAIAGAIIGVIAQNGELMETAEIFSNAIEQVYDTLAQEMGEEHADIWLGYVQAQFKAIESN